MGTGQNPLFPRGEEQRGSYNNNILQTGQNPLFSRGEEQKGSYKNNNLQTGQTPLFPKREERKGAHKNDILLDKTPFPKKGRTAISLDKITEIYRTKALI